MNVDTLSSLVGDMPVSEQIAIAILRHDHKDCAKSTDVEELKQKIEELFNLVGDESVAEQIEAALKNIR